MFLEKIKKWLERISIKITMVFLLLFVLGSSFLFLTFYLIYNKTLASKDNEILASKAQSYIAIYKVSGPQALKNFLVSKPAQENSAFYVRIENKKHHSVLYYAPPFLDQIHQNEIEKYLTSIGNKPGLSYITLKDTDNDYEFLSTSISDDEMIQVGRNIDDRDEFLDVYEETFLAFIVFSIFIGGVFGIFFSSRMLRPIRELIKTVTTIRHGDENARVPLGNNKDELGKLITLFNQMLDHVQNSNRAIRETLDCVAHQLRTPLTSVRAEAELTLRKYPKEEDYRNNIQNSIEGIDQVLEEFNQMMDITEIESGLNNLKKENVDINRLCEDMIELYEIVAEEKQIDIVFLAESLPLLAIDKTRVRQAIANLIDNAIKYSEEKTCITILTGKTYHHLFIKIIDEGMGISNVEITNIWKRLYRGEKSRKQRGIGLGLSLAKSIIEAHGGEISVESIEGHGSTFTVNLPNSP